MRKLKPGVLWLSFWLADSKGFRMYVVWVWALGFYLLLWVLSPYRHWVLVSILSYVEQAKLNRHKVSCWVIYGRAENPWL